MELAHPTEQSGFSSGFQGLGILCEDSRRKQATLVLWWPKRLFEESDAGWCFRMCCITSVHGL